MINVPSPPLNITTEILRRKRVSYRVRYFFLFKRNTNAENREIPDESHDRMGPWHDLSFRLLFRGWI